MGSFTSKSVTKNDPWAPAQPYILKGLENSGRVFDAQQPNLDKFSGMQMDSYSRLAPGAEQGVMGAQRVVNDNLSGKNLNGNPYLDGIRARTRESVTGAVGDEFGMSGRYGSGMHAGILADRLSRAENDLQFQNYGMERGYQQQGIADAQGLMQGSQSMLNNAAELPWLGVGALNGNVRTASNGYGTQTTRSTPPLGPMILRAAGSLASQFAGSDRRLKTNIEKIGEYANGLGRYVWDYLSPPCPEIAPYMDAGRFEGVMADEVAKTHPWALGPVVAGYATVNYGVLQCQ